MNITRHLATLTALLLLSGCASITTGTTQSIAVDTNPQRPADCRLSNEKGSWGVRAPGVTTVTKAYGPLSVTCTTQDGWGGSTAVQSTTAGAAYGNILAGGIIGAAVDMNSGAAYVYPAQVFVPLAQGGYATAAALSPPPPPPSPEPQRGGYRQRSQPTAQPTSATPYPQQPYPAYPAYQPPPPGYYYPPPGYQPPPQGYAPPPQPYPAPPPGYYQPQPGYPQQPVYQAPSHQPEQPNYRPPSRRTNKPD